MAKRGGQILYGGSGSVGAAAAGGRIARPSEPLRCSGAKRAASQSPEESPALHPTCLRGVPREVRRWRQLPPAPAFPAAPRYAGCGHSEELLCFGAPGRRGGARRKTNRSLFVLTSGKARGGGG